VVRKKTYWTTTEIIEQFQVDERFINVLEKGEIVCSTCRENDPAKKYRAEEVEKLRLAKVLMEEMEVNVPGVEVVLHMRQKMIEMRRQFDAILEELARHVHAALEERKSSDRDNT